MLTPKHWMKPSEFRPLAMRTNETKGPEHDILHSMMGIVSEALELIQAGDYDNIIEEIGDIHWYYALLEESAILTHTGSDLKLDYKSRNGYGIAGAAACIEEVASAAKAWFAYDKRAIPMGAIEAILLFARRQQRVDCRRDPLGECIAKLKKRYPRKFSKKQAIERADKECT